MFSQNTRNSISEHQDFKIVAPSFGVCVILQRLKIIPVLHTQKVGQSAISTVEPRYFEVPREMEKSSK